MFLRTVMGFLRDRARARGILGGRSGAVAVVQRFGAALNLNVHVLALVLDGVFTLDATGAARAGRTLLPLAASPAAIRGVMRPVSESRPSPVR